MAKWRLGGSSALTVRGYRYDLSHLMNWLLQTSKTKILSLGAIKSADVSAYRRFLVDVKRLKAASINRRVQVLKTFFAWADSQGELKENPSGSLRFISIERRKGKPESLSPKEVQAILRAAGASPYQLGKRNYAIVQLMLQAGLKVGEIARLRISDVTLYGRSGFVIVRGFTQQKRRDVALNVAARRALSAYLNERGKGKAEDFLFHSNRGGPLSIRAIEQSVTGFGERTKIEKVSSTVLRNTFAVTFLKKRPDDIMELSKIMGHETTNTTAIYAR